MTDSSGANARPITAIGLAPMRRALRTIRPRPGAFAAQMIRRLILMTGGPNMQLDAARAGDSGSNIADDIFGVDHMHFRKSGLWPGMRWEWAGISDGVSAREGTTMPDDAVQMQQIGSALGKRPDHTPSTYLGRVLDKAWARLWFMPQAGHGHRSDGLEAFDMLGGWKGPEGTRQHNK